MSNDAVELDFGSLDNDLKEFGSKILPRLKLGDNESKKVRILRHPSVGQFYIVRSQHWQIPFGADKAPPRTCNKKHFKSSCYYCDESNRLYNSADPSEKAISNRTYAKTVIKVQVLDVDRPRREDGTPNIYVFDINFKTWSEKLLPLFKDKSYGDLTHPLQGRDITVKKVKKTGGKQGGNNDAASEFVFMVAGAPTPLVLMEALDHLYDLEAAFPMEQVSYQEQQLIWSGAAGSSGRQLGSGRSTLALPEPDVGDFEQDSSLLAPDSAPAPVAPAPVPQTAPVVPPVAPAPPVAPPATVTTPPVTPPPSTAAPAPAAAPQPSSSVSDLMSKLRAKTQKQ